MTARSGLPVLLLVLAGAVGVLSGCGGGGLPATHYYTLGSPGELPSRTADAGGDGGLAIGVESLAVDAPYDQDRIVYRRRPDSTEVGFYNYHRWASPVGRLLQNRLVEGLRGAPGVGSIEPATSNGDYDARLGGRVLYLEHIDSPSSQEVRVSVWLELRDGDEALWSTTVKTSSTSDLVDASDVATLLARVVNELVERARTELTAALSG